MATGYEDWVQYRVVNPPLALQRLQSHVQGLMELLSSGRVAADGVSDDPSLIEAQLSPRSFLMKEMNRLSSICYGVGLPMLQPTRRVDGGTICAPDTGTSGGT